MKSLGFIEIPTVAAAIYALDTMCTVVVQGDVAAVTQAVEAAAKNAIKPLAAHAVIANPHEEIWRMIAISQEKLKESPAI